MLRAGRVSSLLFSTIYIRKCVVMKTVKLTLLTLVVTAMTAGVSTAQLGNPFRALGNAGKRLESSARAEAGRGSQYLKDRRIAAPRPNTSSLGTTWFSVSVQNLTKNPVVYFLNGSRKSLPAGRKHSFTFTTGTGLTVRYDYSFATGSQFRQQNIGAGTYSFVASSSGISLIKANPHTPNSGRSTFGAGRPPKVNGLSISSGSTSTSKAQLARERAQREQQLKQQQQQQAIGAGISLIEQLIRSGQQQQQQRQPKSRSPRRRRRN